VIIKTQFTPWSMWPFVRFELALGLVASTATWLLVDYADLHQIILPVTVVTVLGTALSILLAVRANTAYQRWWEASAMWAQITALSRNLIRVATTVSDSKTAAGADAEVARSFQHDLARQQVTYVIALRHALRAQQDTPGARAELLPYLSPENRDRVLAADNRPAMLLQLHSARIFRAYQAGLLAGFDNFQLETALAGLAQQQALAERTASQPVPRSYDVFSRYLVHLYTVIFPLAVIGTVTRDRWIVIPATLIIAYAFRMVERIGSSVDTPFAGTRQDVPMTAATITIERDLYEAVGIDTRPAAATPQAGYLW
jgi:putative membrane protein